jgi:hypothetical protein
MNRVCVVNGGTRGCDLDIPNPVVVRKEEVKVLEKYNVESPFELR